MNTKYLLLTVFFTTTSIVTGNLKASENPNRKLERVTFNVDNDRVRTVLEKNRNATFFKKDQLLNMDVFQKERARIVQLVQNKADVNFSAEQVKFYVDTTASADHFTVETRIKDR